MKTRNLSTITSCLLLSAGLLAQTATTIKTATAYGVAVQAGTATGFDGVATGTVVTSATPVRLTAKAGNSYAYSNVYALTNGVSLTDYGSAYVSKYTASSATAGTTTDQTGKIGDAHTVTCNVPVKSGTIGQVVITWSPYIIGGGTVGAVINVNGTDVATFTEKDPAATKRVDVTAGTNGVDIKVTTNGLAALTAEGRDYYRAYTRAWFEAGVTSGKCTFTPFGSKCGLDLSGTSLTYIRSTYNYNSITLTIEGMDTNAIGLAAVGDILTTPVTLPAGGCMLLVNPTAIVPIRSSTRISLFNKNPVTINIQAVSLTLTSTGVTLATSNGLTATCPKP